MQNTSLKIYFSIMGDMFDVNEITNTLEIRPCETWKKGDAIRNTEKKRTYTAWNYSTDEIETLDLNILIKEITKIFLPKKNEIIELKKRYDLEISIEFVVSIENNQPPAIYFEENFIKFVAEIGARMDLDTYIY